MTMKLLQKNKKWKLQIVWLMGKLFRGMDLCDLMNTAEAIGFARLRFCMKPSSNFQGG